MPFEAKKQAYHGTIGSVTLGTGENAITLGGQSVLPFYGFDAPIPNEPKIGVEISDIAVERELPELSEFYAGCTDMAQRAARAAQMDGCDFICLSFASADPNGENRAVADCVRDAVAVADAVSKPIAVMGCRNAEKDIALFSEIAHTLPGRNILFLSAKEETYFQLAEAISPDSGHKLCAETADDISLAKQLNILLRGASVPASNTVMNIGTAAVGYGYEYVASTLDRIRLAALEQNDENLQLPIVAPVASDAWEVKESTASEEDEPSWGEREERGISMEITTAAANLTGGADAVILRHPAAVAAVKKWIDALI